MKKIEIAKNRLETMSNITKCEIRSVSPRRVYMNIEMINGEKTTIEDVNEIHLASNIMKYCNLVERYPHCETEHAYVLKFNLE